MPRHRDCLNQGQTRIPILPFHEGPHPIFGDVDRVINPCHPLIAGIFIITGPSHGGRNQRHLICCCMATLSFRALGHWQLESARNVLTAGGNSVSKDRLCVWGALLFCFRHSLELAYLCRHQTGVTETLPNGFYSTFTAEAPPSSITPSLLGVLWCILHAGGHLIPSRGLWNESSSCKRTVLINYSGLSLRLLPLFRFCH